MGFFSGFFRKKEKKIDNHITVHVSTLLQYPEIFDGDKIHDKFSKYFSDYFEKNKVLNSVYDGVELLFGPAAYGCGDRIKNKILFENFVDETIDKDKAILDWTNFMLLFFDNLTKNIKIYFKTMDEDLEDLNHQMDLLEKLEEINNKWRNK